MDGKARLECLMWHQLLVGGHLDGARQGSLHLLGVLR